MRPIIGMTCNYMSKVDSAVEEGIADAMQDFHLLAADYTRAVEKAGGVPLLLPISMEETVLEKMVALCDAFIITGGNDVQPGLYGEELVQCGTLVPERDAFDIALATHLLERTRKPLLGICRGCQILNVALGGTLYQDLSLAGFARHTGWERPREEAVHQVRIAEGSQLYRIVGCRELAVNSFHHQAIHAVAPSVDVAAVSEDGVVEAIDCREDRFFLGVQWHPEMMFTDPIEQRIFHALVEAAK